MKCPAGVLSVHSSSGAPACSVRAESGVSSCPYTGLGSEGLLCVLLEVRLTASSEVDPAHCCSLVAGESPVEPRKFTSSPSRADGQTRGSQGAAAQVTCPSTTPCPTLPNPLSCCPCGPVRPWAPCAFLRCLLPLVGFAWLAELTPVSLPCKHQPPACAVGVVQSGKGQKEQTCLYYHPALGHSPASSLPSLAGHALRASSEDAGVPVEGA